jgi:hypothetical protein
MPYYNERANKFSHEKIINNQLFKNKLKDYKITFDIGENDNGYESIKTKFVNKDDNNESKAIDYIFTVDSSFMEIPVNEEIPTAKIGIINFGSSIINLKMKSNVYEEGFINPQKFNDIYNSSMFTFMCPTFNVTLKDDKNLSTLDCIRKEIYDFYYMNKPFSDIRLINTLFNIMKSNMESFELKCTNETCITQGMGTSTCSPRNNFKLGDVGIEPFYCPYCGEIMYITDYLRLHEAVDIEFGNNTILTRFAQVTEHIININAIDSLLKHRSYDLLSRTAFIIDGPLAIYGEPAKLNRSILKYLHSVSKIIDDGIVYFGILKTGKLKDHFNLLLKKLKTDENEIPKNTFMLVDDNYRFKYVQKAPRENKYFGQEVLFGQDYLFYSKDQKRFVISILYPVESRDKNFGENVFNHKNYRNLQTILNLINNISIDLYEDAVLPVALAHKYAAISLNPGTNILEIFIRENLN